jgi:hypothetical protein
MTSLLTAREAVASDKHVFAKFCNFAAWLRVALDLSPSTAGDVLAISIA